MLYSWRRYPRMSSGLSKGHRHNSRMLVLFRLAVPVLVVKWKRVYGLFVLPAVQVATILICSLAVRSRVRLAFSLMLMTWVFFRLWQKILFLFFTPCKPAPQSFCSPSSQNPLNCLTLCLSSISRTSIVNMQTFEYRKCNSTEVPRSGCIFMYNYISLAKYRFV